MRFVFLAVFLAITFFCFVIGTAPNPKGYNHVALTIFIACVVSGVIAIGNILAGW